MIALASGVFNAAAAASRDLPGQRRSRTLLYSLRQRKGISSRVAKSNSVVTRLTAEREMHYREKIAGRVIISILRGAIGPGGEGGWPTSERM